MSDLSSDQRLQFGNGYAEIRGYDLFIAVEGRCLAMPLAKWMDAGWDRDLPSPQVVMQDAVIHDFIRKNESLQRQCDELREIALLTARSIR